MIYEHLVRPLLFKLDPETAHHFTLQILKIAQTVPLKKEALSVFFSCSRDSLSFNLMNLKFNNPIGLAAGFDKNCELLKIISSFGFGYIEGGTITPKPQTGNPKPRLFRFPEQKALINRLGFNSLGADWVEKNLTGADFDVPIGINLGKNKDTPQDLAAEDYTYSLQKLYDHADYFTVNVSSPNTPGLRDLQHNLSPLLEKIQQANLRSAQKRMGTMKPLFVKIAPDCSFSDLDKIAECCINHHVTGLIATNTTCSREGMREAESIEGGLSGKPLAEKSTQIVKYLYKNYGKKLVLMGVGGIFTADDAYQKIKAGASLVQIYTGWIYGGPSTAACIARGLAERLKKDGIKNVRDAVGKESE